MKSMTSALLTCLLGMMIQTTFATNTDLVCPSAEQMSNFNYLASFPYGFNQHTKRMNFLVTAVEPEGGTRYMNGDWLVLTYPLEAQPSDNIPALMSATFKKLQPFSATPFQFSIVDDLTLPLCVYTSQENSNMNVMAYFIDNGYYDDEDCGGACDGDFSHSLQTKKKHHRLRMMKMAKHVKKLLMN